METKYFKLIAAIAEVGSLTRAADRLYLTQSALSHQLKEVEDLLRTKLFNRVNKKLVLTDAGRTFLNSSQVILSEMDRLARQINNQVRGEGGSLTICTECYTCYHWLPAILRSYQKEFPNVEVKLSTQNVTDPVDLLLNGKVDIAILYRKVPHKNVIYTELFTDEMIALVSESNSLAQKRFLNARDFQNQNYITHSSKFDKSHVYENFLKPAGVLPTKTTYIPLTEAVIEMVREGLGMTVLARWLAKPYLSHGAIKGLRLGKNGFKRRWYLATLKTPDHPRFLTRFADLLKIGIPA